MSIKTKLIGYPTLIAVVAVVAIWLQVEPGTNDMYVLSATWSPEVMPKNKEVKITVMVNGSPSLPIPRRLSPWSETLALAPGTEVILTVVSNNADTQMVDCMIMKNSRSVGSQGHDKRFTPGIVTCIN